MSHLVTHVPEDIGRSFDAADLSALPLLALLERAGVRVAAARQTVSATLADPGVAAALGVPAGSALTEVVRSVQDEAGRGVEHIRVLYRPDVWRIEMTLRRVAGAEGPRWRTEAAAPGELAEGGAR
jgi:GntR family transcriptional regulator